NGITIPQSTVVNTASLKVFQFAVMSAPLTLRFQGKKLATPVVPTAVAQVITPGTLATASASFAGITPGTGAYQTYSIKAIVQELVNAFDYANDKMLFFHNSLSGRVFVRAYDFNAAQSANLVINFVGGDSTDPTISTLSPADGETGVGIASNLVLTFDEAVDVESGNITIYDAADDSATATIAVTDGQVTGTGTTAITVNPTSDLIGGTSYYVQVAATGFDDAAGNSYAGIANTTTWNFSTAEASFVTGNFNVVLNVAGGGSVVPGDILKATISLSNTTASNFSNTKLKLILPTGIKYKTGSANPSSAISINDISTADSVTTLTIDSFLPNSSATIDLDLAIGTNVQPGQNLSIEMHTENDD
ncbi:MAG: hypothetical protein ACI9CF_001899, partial [Candidatus Omnitrophota bacterium]